MSKRSRRRGPFLDLSAESGMKTWTAPLGEPIEDFLRRAPEVFAQMRTEEEILRKLREQYGLTREQAKGMMLGALAGHVGMPTPAPAPGATATTPPAPFVPLQEDISILAVLENAGRAMKYPEIARASVTLAAESHKRGENTLISVSDSVLRQRVPILRKHNLVTRPLSKDGRPTERKGIGITSEGRDLLMTVLPKTTLIQR